MRLKLIIIACLAGFISHAQTIIPIPRSPLTAVAKDQRIQGVLNLTIPVYPDTATANTNIGADSLGALIQIRSTGVIYHRDTTAGVHKWSPMASGTTSTAWGTLTGGNPLLQTDLAALLNAKQATINLGPITQYFRGDLSLVTFPTDLSAFSNSPAYVSSLVSTNSIIGTGLVAGGNQFQLVNDASAPGVSVYYGTNAGGVKGFYSLPSVFSAISGLTGDILATGPGNVAATLATVNANIYGSNTFLKHTASGKGLILSATPVVSLDITTAEGFTSIGDIMVGTGSNAAARLAIGATNKVLTVVGGTAVWATPAAGFADPTTTNGDIIAHIAGVTTRLPQGTNGQFIGVSGGVMGYFAPPSGFADPTTTNNDIIAHLGGITTRLAGGANNTVLSINGSGVLTYNLLTTSNLNAAAGITNAQLANSSMTLNGTSVSLGGTFSVTDANISVSNITTNNASITQHGWLPILSNVVTQYLNGIGGYSGIPLPQYQIAVGNVSNLISSSANLAWQSPVLTAGSVALAYDAANTSLMFVSTAQLPASIPNYTTVIGYGAFKNTATGTQNTGIGYRVFQFISSGGLNTALGTNALNAVTVGGSNTGLGNQALLVVTSGSNNMGFGASALSATTTGNSNIGIGAFAGIHFSGAASQNIVIGNDSSTSNVLANNFMFIGHGYTQANYRSNFANIARADQVLGFGNGGMTTTQYTALGSTATLGDLYYNKDSADYVRYHGSGVWNALGSGSGGSGGGSFDSLVVGHRGVSTIWGGWPAPTHDTLNLKSFDPNFFKTRTDSTITNDTSANLTHLATQAYANAHGGTGLAYPATVNKYLNGYGNFPALQMDSIAQGAVNLYEISKSSAPTALNGQLWWNSSFVVPGNSNSAWVWDPGPFIYGTNSANIPLGIENTLNSSLHVKGDSWSANYGLAGAPNGYVNKVAYFRGWGIGNGAISGSKVSDINWTTSSTGNGNVDVMQVGINDERTFLYAGIASYIPAARNVVVYAQASNVIKGQNGSPTTPANWATYTITAYGNSSIATQTLTNNSPIKFNVAGTTVYTSVMDSTGNVTYTITIDGILKGTFTASNTYAATAMADCKRFADLGDSMHVVSLARTSGTGAFIVNFVASNFAPIQATGDGGNKYYVTSVGRMSTGNASSGYVQNGGNDTSVYTYNRYLKAAVYELSSDGLAVSFLDYNKYYDPKVANFSQADSLHPADKGHTSIAEQVLNITSPYVLPQDREVTQIAQEYIKVDPVSGAYFKNSSGIYTPTVTNVANTSGALTSHPAHWIRTGNQVSVDGTFDCAGITLANISTQVYLTLPIPSALAAYTDLMGPGVVAGGVASYTAIVEGDVTGGRAWFIWYPTVTGANTGVYHFTYTIL